MLSSFDTRRQADPQGVINDLIGQTTRQAAAINLLAKENERLKEIFEKSGLEFPVEKPKRTRKKKEVHNQKTIEYTDSGEQS